MNVRAVILVIGMVAVGMSSPVPDTGVAMPGPDKAMSNTHQEQLRDLHARLVLGGLPVVGSLLVTPP
ncbi:hypothetical protein H4S00_006821 [Coemansia sp. D1744]|nr:hypothetical protein H4S00_006821 [Coemansia sp. D1744]